jgi:hypothetical protein
VGEPGEASTAADSSPRRRSSSTRDAETPVGVATGIVSLLKEALWAAILDEPSCGGESESITWDIRTGETRETTGFCSIIVRRWGMPGESFRIADCLSGAEDGEGLPGMRIVSEGPKGRPLAGGSSRGPAGPVTDDGRFPLDPAPATGPREGSAPFCPADESWKSDGDGGARGDIGDMLGSGGRDMD